MNPRTRRAALYAIGAIAILASLNALAHSYAGLYDWALQHRLGGWQAMSWPAEIDVFLTVGELSLYVAYLDGWSGRQRLWPWATALTGLAVSVAGNIGHVAPAPGHPVVVTDRLTAATSPLAAFAGLAIGLLVLKMIRRQQAPAADQAEPQATSVPGPARPVPVSSVPVPDAGAGQLQLVPVLRWCDGRDISDLVADARAICASAAARGERVSQRVLARQLRARGHHFPNDQLHRIAQGIGQTEALAA